MNSVLERIADHLSDTLEALPDGTISIYPALTRGSYRKLHTDAGGRLELEEQVGQSRVFVIGLDELEIEPILLGGAVPRAFLSEFPIVMRYEAGGPTRRSEILRQIGLDQLVAVDAVMRSSWSAVSGCVSMQAEPGNIQKFTLSDDTGNTYTGYTSEVLVTCSFDT